MKRQPPLPGKSPPGVPRRAVLGLPLWLIASRPFLGEAVAAPVEPGPGVNQAIERGAGWLLEQQATDGGWHSIVYGQMRCGVGNTALALYALASLPGPPVQRCRVQLERGLTFLLSNLAEPGFVRSPEGESDYPTYATALTLTALRRLPVAGREPQQNRMRQYLIAAQQTESRGWPAARPDLGGWNATDSMPAGPDARDGTSVSIMRFAIEAIASSGPLPAATTLAALGYLGRCQNLRFSGGDGGFCFTSDAENSLNKAGRTSILGTARALSYGTPTADGLWILHRCGVSPKDRRVQDALQWLREHSEIDRVPGISDTETSEQTMRDGLKFYYWSSLAGLGGSFSAEENSQLAKKLTAALVAEQKSDGSWQNTDNSMREDDPLMATSWALTTLGRLTGGGVGLVR